MNNTVEKIYFIPGDKVKVKHNLENSPIMLVQEKVTKRIFTSKICNEPADRFVGIQCGWFDKNNVWRKEIFSTKDLIKVEEVC